MAAVIHPDRLGRPRNLSAIRLLVIHTAESSEGDKTAEVLMVLFASPGDRQNAGGGSFYGASYHAVADTDGEWLQAVPDDHQAKAAAGANVDGLHICYPGRASQTAAEWMDEPSSSMHTAVAKWLAIKSQAYGIPLRWLTPDQVAAGERGVCSHDAVSKAFGRSDHWDPGPNYPAKHVLALATALLDTPPPDPDPGDDDMTPEQMDELVERVALRVWKQPMNVTNGGQPKPGTPAASVVGWTKNDSDKLRAEVARLDAEADARYKADTDRYNDLVARLEVITRKVGG